MAGKEIAVKKYVVRLSGEERERLEAMTYAGKHPARLLTKARILLKADVSEAGEGWSDRAISEALNTSINNIGRTRRRLVEEGLEAALSRKYNPNSPHSTRPSPLRKRAASPNVSNGTTPLNMEAGSIWPNPNSASCDHRNKHHAKADWQFTTDHARVKLKRLYP